MANDSGGGPGCPAGGISWFDLTGPAGPSCMVSLPGRPPRSTGPGPHLPGRQGTRHDFPGPGGLSLLVRLLPPRSLAVTACAVLLVRLSALAGPSCLAASLPMPGGFHGHFGRRPLDALTATLVAVR